jgi:hypothetical protein
LGISGDNKNMTDGASTTPRTQTKNIRGCDQYLRRRKMKPAKLAIVGCRRQVGNCHGSRAEL